MGQREQAELANQLRSLLEATRHLRSALLRVDPVAIQEAVEKQAVTLQALEPHRSSFDELKDRSELLLLIHQIHALNRNNQALTHGGLRVIRSSLKELSPELGYAADGSTPLYPGPSRISTSA